MKSIQNPNNPSVESVLSNATKAQLQNLVTGLEFRHRATTGSNNIFSTFGREIYPLFASDPRFVNQWVGVGEGADAENDPSFLDQEVPIVLPTRQYYRVISLFNLLKLRMPSQHKRKVVI